MGKLQEVRNKLKVPQKSKHTSSLCVAQMSVLLVGGFQWKITDITKSKINFFKHHHHHHFWLAPQECITPLIASSLQSGWFWAMLTGSQQPPEWLVLSHVNWWPAASRVAGSEPCWQVASSLQNRVCKPGRLFQTRVFGFGKFQTRVSSLPMVNGWALFHYWRLSSP